MAAPIHHLGLWPTVGSSSHRYHMRGLFWQYSNFSPSILQHHLPPRDDIKIRPGRQAGGGGKLTTLVKSMSHPFSLLRKELYPAVCPAAPWEGGQPLNQIFYSLILGRSEVVELTAHRGIASTSSIPASSVQNTKHTTGASEWAPSAHKVALNGPTLVPPLRGRHSLCPLNLAHHNGATLV